MRESIARLLDSPRPVAAATLVTIALGYVFIFVWAPHPWSWQGIDAYHELAKSLARGESFQTTDVPWAYAYYAAFFYWLFGERVWVPLVVQATLNGAVPFLLYRLVEPLAGRRVAVLSALIVGVFSFNTIYASTQSSDTICTVLFLAGLLWFARGARESRPLLFLASGAVLGLVPQFRPNMVLFPGVMVAAYLLLKPRQVRKMWHAALFTIVVVALQVPWIVRNYQLTGLLLPTSTHGGVQLWYGTLQVGPYLESRAHNPRYVFESAAFDYSSLSGRPILIEAVQHPCLPDRPSPTVLVYWTDRDARVQRVPPRPGLAGGASVAYEIPPQPTPTTIYYYFEQSTPAHTWTTPSEGARDPYIAFVAGNHLGDLDSRGELLDAFDLARMLKHIAWGDALPAREKLDLDDSGAVDAADVGAAIGLLAADLVRVTPKPPEIRAGDDRVTLVLGDGSSFTVPRTFSDNLADIEVTIAGEMAGALVSRRHTFTSIAFPQHRALRGDCEPAAEVRMNARFNWREPHMMNRYMALAFDNIRRDPSGFALASLYRALRLFIVYGTDDRATSQQFSGSGVVYRIGLIASLTYLGVFAAGVVIAAKRRSALLLFLIPIVYVPATICFVLTNMRYTVTVQPLMFAFVALAVVEVLRLEPSGRSFEARSDR